MGEPDQAEIRLLILEGLKKGARQFIQPMRYARQQVLAAFQQRNHADRLGRHALEMGLEASLESVGARGASISQAGFGLHVKYTR